MLNGKIRKIRCRGRFEEDRKQLITPEFILKVFSRISDEDCEVMGFSRDWCRPDWLICSLPVPHQQFVLQSANLVVSVVKMILHTKLHDIIKTNNHLKKKLDSENILKTQLMIGHRCFNIM